MTQYSPDLLRSQGWEPRIVDQGFNGTISPFWSNNDSAGAAHGFFAEERHMNGHLGTVHGGVIMTFADNSLGTTVVRALGHAHCATVQLQLQFVAAAYVGDFISCTPEIVRQTRQLVFMRGLIKAEDRVIASADGLWKVLEAR